MNSLIYHWPLSAARPFHLDIQRHAGAMRYARRDMHHAVHLIAVLSGSFSDYSGELHRAGSFCMTRPWAVHGDTRSDCGVELLVLTVDPDELLKAFRGTGEELSVFFRRPPEEIASLLAQPEVAGPLSESVRRLMAQTGAMAQIRQYAVIQEIFADLLEGARIFCPPPTCSGHEAQLAPALKLLYRGEFPVTVGDAARSCSLSSGFFSHRFKEVFGISFARYELQYRLNGAAAELIAGNAQVKDTAHRWGFYDRSHFSRTFKRFFGVAPADYPG